MYIVQKLDEIYCRHRPGPFDLWCDLVLEFLYGFFVLMTYLLVTRGIKVFTTTVLEFLYFVRSLTVCKMKLGAMTLGAYRLIVITSFWCFPFYYYRMSFFISFDQCRFEVYFARDKHCYSCLFSGGMGIALVKLLPAFHPKPVLVSVDDMCLL
jgi:hypothetical protein